MPTLGVRRRGPFLRPAAARNENAPCLSPRAVFGSAACLGKLGETAQGLVESDREEAKNKRQRIGEWFLGVALYRVRLIEITPPRWTAQKERGDIGAIREDEREHVLSSLYTEGPPLKLWLPVETREEGLCGMEGSLMGTQPLAGEA